MPTPAADYRLRAEVARAQARALEDKLNAGLPPGRKGALTFFPAIRALVALGHAEAIVEARALRARGDALDDVACVLEEPL